MTATGQCPSCGAVQSQAWLCSDCCAAIETMLAAAPALIEQLGIAISKQAKIGGGGKAGKGSVHERSPINFGALAVRDALLVELALWGDDINVIRRHVQAADIASGIGKAVKNAYRAIDRMADRKYLGKCNHKIGGLNCPEELWVRPNARDVRCKSCQYEHNVADRRLDMLEMAEDQICTPREASRYVGEVGGIEVGHQRIRNYLDRKRIPLYPSADGVQRLRLGDLLDVLRDDAARHDVRAS
jgi:hypothetical protein